jgi:hypothetical protein
MQEEISSNDKKQLEENEGGSLNLGRHEAQCYICRHPQRQGIEEKWIDWCSAYQIAKEHGVSHDSMYRHAHALDLFSKRKKMSRGLSSGLSRK